LTRPSTSSPPHTDLSDTDLHLYLARALPRRQALYMRLALLMNRDLRQRLAALQDEAEAYREERQPRLADKIFGPWNFNPRAAEAAPSSLLWRRRGPLYAMAAVVVALGLWPIYLTQRMAHHITTENGGAFEDASQGVEPGVDYTAKGAPADMQLFVKGDTLRRVAGIDVRITARDTLQLVPPGGAQPYLAIYGFESLNGIAGPVTRLFPQNGIAAVQVSAQKPPPGLTVAGTAENRLICIASDRGFDLALAESTLSNMRRTGLQNDPQKPDMIWPKGWRVQTFQVRPSP
jgi:hypothetical protein